MATIERAARNLLNTLERFGNYDDGCFYYGKFSAPELERPMEELRNALGRSSNKMDEPNPFIPTPDSRQRFRDKFERDNCNDMTDDQWGKWVDDLLPDEFGAMIEASTKPNSTRESDHG